MFIWENAHSKWRVGYRAVSTVSSHFIRKKDGKINVKIVISSIKLEVGDWGVCF